MTQHVFREEGFTGWGRDRVAWTTTASPSTVEELQELATVDGPERIGRGMGRTYGDASLNSNRLTVRFDQLDHALSFDQETGVLVCEAGMTLASIIRMALPRGWFLPATPGTSHPTIGGSVACDVHGKNHHRAGTIGKHVLWLDLVKPDGELVRCSRTENVPLFRATMGGMGLTGWICRVAIQLIKAPTAYIVQESCRVDGLAEMMDQLTVSDETHPYTVSWMDCAIGGSHLGRGHVMLGRHAEVDELPFDKKSNPRKIAKSLTLDLPFVPPLSLVNNYTVRVFNNLNIQTAPRAIWKHVVPYRPFFYPLDVATNWNRLYGPAGFVQYQFVVPFDGAERALREVIVRCHRRRQLPSLVVLKRFGAEGDGYLSFPKPGWTLAMDLPVVRGLWTLLDDLDKIILEHGGRVYLTKDVRMSGESFREMYPEFKEFMDVKNEIDPEWRFSSDLSRRLRMEDGI